MKYLSLPFRYLYTIYGILLFVVLMLMIFPFVLIASLFGRTKGGQFVYFLCHFWADVWLLLMGIYHMRIGDVKHGPDEHFIYIANHTSYLDIPQILKAVRRPFRVLGKAEMLNYPVFGFIYRMAVVTVDRTDAENRARSVRILKKLTREGMSIFIFPEGTFPAHPEQAPLQRFYDGAFRIAIETGTPIRPLLFLDNPERMHPRGLFSLSPGKMRTVYLPPVSVDGYSLRDLPALKEKLWDMMEESLRHYRVYPD